MAFSPLTRLRKMIGNRWKDGKQFVAFLTDVANDPRIPVSDKRVVLALIGMILSPISPLDLIPRWVPILGQVDEVVLGALILDYFFSVLDPEIVRGHYPWGDRSFLHLQRASKLASAITPRMLKRAIWRYPTLADRMSPK